LRHANFKFKTDKDIKRNKRYNEKQDKDYNYDSPIHARNPAIHNLYSIPIMQHTLLKIYFIPLIIVNGTCLDITFFLNLALALFQKRPQ
jgi:hypothetical protein